MYARRLLNRVRRIRHVRRGVTAMLAMLYLILFSALAVGFYGAVTTSVQITANEQRGMRAFLAAESGMEFIRYHLKSISITDRSLSPSDRFDEVYRFLADTLEGYPNLGPHVVGMAGDTITIPADPNAFVSLHGDGSAFRVIIRRAGANVSVTTVGRHEPTGSTFTMASPRGIEMTFGVAQRASAIFDYGVASKSAITLQGNTSIVGAANPAHGSVLTATKSNFNVLTMSGSSKISGDVSIVNPYGTLSIGSSSTIAGYGPGNPKIHNHIIRGVTEPDFPTVDTSIFMPFVTNTYAAGQTTLVNTRIPANTNPTFSGNVKIQGVLYVESPNTVTFNGNTEIQGVIVVPNDAPGSLTSNVLDFSGTVKASSVQSLPPSFGDLRELTGAFVLAPNFHVRFGGNFGTISGSIIGSQIDFYGNAGGTVRGSVINLNDTSLTLIGNSDIIIESQGTSDYPAGVYFGENYVPLPGTYREVKP